MSNNPQFKDEKCEGVELILTDRNAYNSVDIGIATLKTVKNLYPEKLKFNNDWMDKLWGKSGLSDQLFNDSKVEMNSIHFHNTSTKYRLYD